MKKIVPHIYLENCKEAIEYYHHIFGGEIANTRLSDGVAIFKGHEGKYIHAELHINENCVIYFADVFGEKKSGSTIWLSLEMDSENEIKKVYDQLIEDGHVQMELQETFWGSVYAVVVDKNGVTWELNLSQA